MDRVIYATDGEYTIFPIADEDRENYVQLHRQLNGDDTLFLNPYCKDMMWEHILDGKDKVFSIFDNNNEYCGSLEIQRPETEIPEIGIDLLESKRNKGIAARVVKLLAKRAYECPTAHCERYKPHFDFGDIPSPIVPHRNKPQTQGVILQILPIKKALLTSNYFYTLCFF